MAARLPKASEDGDGLASATMMQKPSPHVKHHALGSEPLTSTALTRAAAPTHRVAPRLTMDMSIALRRAGIQLREALVWSSATPRRNESNSKSIVTVVPGLCRLCAHRQWMEEVFALLQRSNIVFLLQSEEDRVFDACVRTIRLVADSQGSSVVVGRQWLSARPSGLPCNQTSGRETRGTFPRVQMQTFAVGRAYDWALHYFPRSRYVARARLDAPSCLPSDDELGRLPKDRPVLVANDYSVWAAGGSRVYFVSDRYAFVHVTAAAAYFEAWRVWLRPRCDHPCLAGLHTDHALALWRGEGNGRCGPNVTANVINGCGECPLASWLGVSKERLFWVRAPAMGDPIVRQLNRTHAAYQGSEGEPVPITHFAAWLHKVRARRTPCLELQRRPRGQH